MNEGGELQLEGISAIIFTCLSAAGLRVSFAHLFPFSPRSKTQFLGYFLLVSPEEYIYIFLSNYSYFIFSLLSHIYPSCGLHRQFLLSFSDCHDC